LYDYYRFLHEEYLKVKLHFEKNALRRSLSSLRLLKLIQQMCLSMQWSEKFIGQHAMTILKRTIPDIVTIPDHRYYWNNLPDGQLKGLSL
jgi:hypothetical protein